MAKMWIKTSVKRLWPGDQKRKLPGDVVEVTEQLGRALLQTDRTWTEANAPSFVAAPAVEPEPDLPIEAPPAPARRGRKPRAQDDVPVMPESDGDAAASQDGQDTVAGGASEVAGESAGDQSEAAVEPAKEVAEPVAEPQAEPAAEKAADATETATDK